MTGMRQLVRKPVRATLAALVVLLLLAAPAAAGPPTTGTGTGTIEIRDVTQVRDAGGNLVQERSLTGTVSGALEGTYTEEVRGVVHRTGLVTFSGRMHFTGTVEGCGEGSFMLGLSGRGVSGEPITDATARVINQSTNTLDIKGTATLHQEGLTFTYEVRYVCS